MALTIKPNIEEEVKRAQKELDEAENFKDSLENQLTKYRKGDYSNMKYLLYFILSLWGISLIMILIFLPFMIFVKWFFS